MRVLQALTIVVIHPRDSYVRAITIVAVIVEILPIDSSMRAHDTIRLDDDTSECTSARSAHVDEHSAFLSLPRKVGIISIVGPLVVDKVP